MADATQTPKFKQGFRHEILPTLDNAMKDSVIWRFSSRVTRVFRHLRWAVCPCHAAPQTKLNCSSFGEGQITASENLRRGHKPVPPSLWIRPWRVDLEATARRRPKVHMVTVDGLVTTWTRHCRRACCRPSDQSRHWRGEREAAPTTAVDGALSRRASPTNPDRHRVAQLWAALHCGRVPLRPAWYAPWGSGEPAGTVGRLCAEPAVPDSPDRGRLSYIAWLGTYCKQRLTGRGTLIHCTGHPERIVNNVYWPGTARAGSVAQRQQKQTERIQINIQSNKCHTKIMISIQYKDSENATATEILHFCQIG